MTSNDPSREPRQDSSNEPRSFYERKLTDLTVGEAIWAAVNAFCAIGVMGFVIFAFPFSLLPVGLAVLGFALFGPFRTRQPYRRRLLRSRSRTTDVA